jgi:pyruvate dehydrogenase E2 component (dihydrolipoamide acetyltransferase)
MEFKLPDIGEGVVEGELIQWLVKEGDTVAADQPVVEVMTDKATVEVPAPVAGKISGLAAKEGDMIKVGQTLAQIDGAGASAAPAKSEDKTAQKAAPAAEKTVEKTEKPSGGEGAGRDQASPTAPTSKPAQAPSNVGSYAGPKSLAPSDVPAAPIVRAMAQKAGVDLSNVPASGPKVGSQSRVLEEDLLRFLNQGAGAVQAGAASYAPAAAQGTAAPAKKQQIKPIPASFVRDFSTQAQDERQPLRGLRRVIAQAMVRSKYTAPHYSYVDKFECSALVAMREEAKKVGEQYGVKISYLPFIVKALVGALKEFPTANASLEETEKGMELVLKKHYHIGIAVATPDGLIVPVIKDADKKTILQIAQEINDLSARTRAGKATADELKGSTFTITSMGNIGGLFATPIINYPEVGIMGVYKVQEEPLVQDGQIVIGKTMHLSLSLDHRVVDGAVGGYFCNAVIERLQNPARLLMEMV